MKSPLPSNAPNAFTASHARSYASGPARQVPGLDGLHRMTSLLLAERVPEQGRVLVLGAGGGLELNALAGEHSGWRFDGVDPSPDMLQLARQTAAAHAARIDYHEGDITAAPEGPFDGAVCLLTMHFVPREQRLSTLVELRRRMRPGAPFVVAHISFSQDEPERSLAIARHVAFGATASTDIDQARHAIGTRLSVLSPQDDEALLNQAGFADVGLFYAALSFRGWLGYAP